jgi:hypothetical protein
MNKKPNTQREPRTSSPLTVKSISIKLAECVPVRYTFQKLKLSEQLQAYNPSANNVRVIRRRPSFSVGVLLEQLRGWRSMIQRSFF